MFGSTEGVGMDACEILQNGIDAIGDRASQRDLPSGERSMLRAVNAFAKITGVQMTETQGWWFMAVLKIARSTAGAHRLDDYVDAAAYAALAGEASERAQQPTMQPTSKSLSAAAFEASCASMMIEIAERDE